MNVIFRGMGEHTHAVGQSSRVGGFEGSTVGGRGQLSSYDVVAAHARETVGIIALKELQSALQNMRHWLCGPARGHEYCALKGSVARTA